MHSTTASLLLTKLNAGKRYFLYSELSDCSDNSSFNARRELRELINQGFVREADEGGYKIIVDIYTVRKSILKSSDGDTPQEPAMASDCNLADIVNSVWHIKGDNEEHCPDGEDDDDIDDDEEATEAEEYRMRREYLEKRRLELVERMRKQIGEHNEEDDDEDDDEDEASIEGDEDDGDDEMSDDSSSVDNDSHVHDSLMVLLAGETEIKRQAIAALKICASEGYLTPWLICKNLGISEEASGVVCLLLSLNSFIRKVPGNDEKYLLNISEGLFYACCQEAEDSKNTPAHLNTESRWQQYKEEINENYKIKWVNFRSEYKVYRELIGLINSDLKMSRTMAIAKAEGYLLAARDMGNDSVAALYEEVVEELKTMSNYRYNQLKDRPGN